VPRFTCPFEAALALLDNQVTALRYFYHHPEAEFIINDTAQFKKEVGREAHVVVKAHLQRLEDAVDFALAYVTVDLNSIRRRPTNGQGIDNGMLLYKRHQERFSAMGRS